MKRRGGEEKKQKKEAEAQIPMENMQHGFPAFPILFVERERMNRKKAKQSALLWQDSSLDFVST